MNINKIYVKSTHIKSELVFTGCGSGLGSVDSDGADGLIAATQVTEGHSGVEHMEQWDL